MAALLGVDVDRTISLTFVIGAACWPPSQGVHVPDVLWRGELQRTASCPASKPSPLRFWAASARSPAPVLGGLLIGLIETFWSAYFSIEYKDVAAFSILAITLVFMPQGLLGRPEVEKV